MKIKVVDVVRESGGLRVTFDRGRNDWANTPEGVRAVRILRCYGPLRVDGREVVVVAAANESKINTRQACQLEMDRWADEKVTFEFLEIVSSSAKQALRNMSEVQAALSSGLQVQAYLDALATLPILQRDYVALTEAGYGRALTDSSHHLYGVAFRLLVTRGLNPWTMLKRLQSDIERIIK